jgi:pimeloyl-ACP methyl ester carboxylesterase
MPALVLSDGTSLHYEDWGQGTPILLVHGFGMTGESFFKQRILRNQFRIIVPDLRGWGKSTSSHSSSAQKPNTIKTMGDDVFELISHLELDKIVYVGWSMGAMVFWEAAKSHSLSNISHMIAVDMSPKVLNSTDWQYGLIGSVGLETKKGKARAKRAISEMLTNWAATSKRIIRKIFASNSFQNDRAKLSADIETLLSISNSNSGENAAQCWQSLIECDCSEIVKSINIPTSIVQGLGSQLYANDVCVAVCKSMPNCKLYSFQFSGHAPHVEQPNEFNQLVETIANSVKTKAIEPILIV